MELGVIKDTFEHIVKKQKLSLSVSREVIDQVSHEIVQASAQFQREPNESSDQKSIFLHLKSNLSSMDPLHLLEEAQKEQNLKLSKFPKILGKHFNPDISKASRNVDFDIRILNQLIATHFYRQGLFEIGDSMTQETGETELTPIKSHFVQMHEILEAVKIKNLEPALKWTATNHEKLKQNNSNLEFKLHCLQFVEILQNKTQAQALDYARTHLAQFASLHSINKVKFQKLMCSLLWSGRLEKSPYSGLLSPTGWNKLPEELTRQFCNLLGQSYNCSLRIVIEAGFDGLPTLLKLANVMAAKKQEWLEMKQLPVPLELGKKFQFHSIFVCPVSRDQGSEENPPMLMPCLHVLCKQSIERMSKGNSKKFKCPYCPVQVSVSQCRQLYF